MKTIFSDNYKEAQESVNESSARIWYGLSVTVCLLFFIYAICRAWFVGITHDEAYTFEHFCLSTYPEVVNQYHTILNNHMLNSFLVKISYQLFGAHVFVLRIPTLVALILYMYYGFRLMKDILVPILVFPAMILLCCNPYLLEFYSLARGYAGGITMMMIALYYAHVYISGRSTKKSLWVAIVSAAISVFFHLGMMNFFVPFLGVLILWLAIKGICSEEQKPIIKRIYSLVWRPVLVGVIMAIYALPLVHHYKEVGEFDFSLGHDQNLHDTFVSLFRMSSYWKYPVMDYELWVKYSWPIVILVLGIAGILLILPLVQAKKPDYKAYYLFNYILLISVMAVLFLQHIILKSFYPIERYILFLLPVFMMVFVFVISELYKKSTTYLALSVIVCLLCIGNFVYGANLAYSLNWKTDAKTSEVINLLEKIHSKKPAEDLSVGCDWTLEPGMNYYRFYRKLYWLHNFSREGFCDRYKYYYLPSESLHEIPLNQMRLVYTNPVNGMQLYENLKKSDSLIAEANTKPNEYNDKFNGEPCINNKSWNRVTITKLELPLNKKLLVEACLKVHVNSSRLGTRSMKIVISEEHAPVTKLWKTMDLNTALIKGDQDWQEIWLDAIIPPLTDYTGDLNAILENAAGEKILIKDIRLRIWVK